MAFFFFHARNSELLHFLSGIPHNLRKASLASEVLKARCETVKVRIGHPISLEEQAQFSDLAAHGQYLRRRTFVIGGGFPKGLRIESLAQQRTAVERLLNGAFSI